MASVETQLLQYVVQLSDVHVAKAALCVMLTTCASVAWECAACSIHPLYGGNRHLLPFLPPPHTFLPLFSSRCAEKKGFFRGNNMNHLTLSSSHLVCTVMGGALQALKFKHDTAMIFLLLWVIFLSPGIDFFTLLFYIFLVLSYVAACAVAFFSSCSFSLAKVLQVEYRV